MAFSSFETLGVIVGGALFVVGILFAIQWYRFWRLNKDQLITHGMHSHIRHPQYLPALSILSSFYLVRPDTINLFILIIAILTVHITIKKEESQLIARFKDEYREYMKKVPWRLIPRVY
jgi:protein-S-isoprenylcysteine O-methyltransferase Ste14